MSSSNPHPGVRLSLVMNTLFCLSHLVPLFLENVSQVVWHLPANLKFKVAVTNLVNLVTCSTKTSSLPKSSERPTSWSRVPTWPRFHFISKFWRIDLANIQRLTFRSGMWNFQFVDSWFFEVAWVRLSWVSKLLEKACFCLKTTWLSRSNVCWQVFSPGAEMSQYSVMALQWYL